MIRARRERLRTLMLLVVAAVSLGVAVAAYATDLLEQPELDAVDTRFAIRGDETTPNDIVVVAIDDVTFDDLNTRWPFPRSMHAQVIDRLRRAGVKTIVYDVQFTEPSTPAEDNALITAVDSARPVVLATTEVNEKGEANIFGGQDVLDSIGARAGNALIPPDQDGLLRQFPYEVDRLKSLAVVGAETATGRAVKRSDMREGNAWIDYRGPPGTIDAVSFSRVLNGKVSASKLRGKIAVVGPSAPVLQDVHPTSVTADQLMSGAEIQANSIWTATHDFPLKESATWFGLLLTGIFALLAPVGSLRLSPLRALVIALSIGLIYVVVTQLAFNDGWILPVVYPLGALLFSSVCALALYYLTAAFERERIREIFTRFVPDTVVDEVLATTDQDLRLGGVRRQATVMFTDLRGFTAFAEELPAERVIQVVNFYLDQMTAAILSAGGTLVAYMGDGIMAIFGAPIVQEDHADRALNASREMLTERLPRFNRWLGEQGLTEDGFRMGIGLNSGEVMSGNVGSEQRLEYTAIGDTTNTAARLEGMTKGTPHQIFLADSTRESLARPASDLVYVDEFDVRGRQARIKVWSLQELDGAVPAPRAGDAVSAPASSPDHGA